MINLLDCLQTVCRCNIWIDGIVLTVLSKRDFRPLLYGIWRFHFDDRLVQGLEFGLKLDSLVIVLFSIFVIVLFLQITDEVFRFNLMLSASFGILSLDKSRYSYLVLLFASLAQCVILCFQCQFLLSLSKRGDVLPFVISGLGWCISIDLQIVCLEHLVQVVLDVPS